MPDSSDATENIFALDPNSWLAGIVESSDDAIVGKTLDGIVRSWNGGASRVFGYHRDEILGRSVLLLIPPELHDEEPAIIARLERGDRVEPFETVRLRRDGTRVEVSLSVSPIRDRAGRIVGAAKIARDVTEAKRLLRAEQDLTEQLHELAAELEQQVDEGQSLQEELQESNEALGRSLVEMESARHEAEEANAAKGRFLTTMSHELRTPLNAIAGYVDLLEQEIRGPLTNDQRHDIIRIRRNQQMLLRLIEEVLDFAKLESGRLQYQYELVRLDDILASLEAFITPRLVQKGLAYKVEPCDDSVMVSIDRAKVEQIMVNLLSNATKFTDSGYIEVRCSVGERDIELHVTDTGPGIHPDLFDAVFDPFVQGDSSLTRTAEGTGLGLSISRTLARAMRGEITVTSTLGKGSTFTLTLPRVGPNVPSNEQ